MDVDAAFELPEDLLPAHPDSLNHSGLPAIDLLAGDQLDESLQEPDSHDIEDDEVLNADGADLDEDVDEEYSAAEASSSPVAAPGIHKGNKLNPCRQTQLCKGRTVI